MEEKARSKNDGGRVIPQDIVAEKSLLGAIMISDSVLSISDISAFCQLIMISWKHQSV